MSDDAGYACCRPGKLSCDEAPNATPCPSCNERLSGWRCPCDRDARTGKSAWNCYVHGPAMAQYRDRRERIATAVLAAYRAHGGVDVESPENVAEWAVIDADALIAALDAEAGDGTR